jgi:hypothetical protein
MKKYIFSVNHKTISIILILYFLLSLTGCLQTVKEFPLVTSTNCFPPCWVNIVPGRTTKQEVITILKESSIIDSKSIVIKGESWNSFNDVVLFTTLSNNIDGEIYFVDDIAVFIGLYGDININFSNAIERLGEPEYIINIPMYNPNKSYEIFALIPKDGVNFAYNTQDKGITSKSEITQENKITRVDFFDPNFFDYLSEAGTFSEGFLDSIQTKKYMVPWSGYGELDQKYPSAAIP